MASILLVLVLLLLVTVLGRYIINHVKDVMNNYITIVMSTVSIYTLTLAVRSLSINYKAAIFIGVSSYLLALVSVSVLNYKIRLKTETPFTLFTQWFYKVDEKGNTRSKN